MKFTYHIQPSSSSSINRDDICRGDIIYYDTRNFYHLCVGKHRSVRLMGASRYRTDCTRNNGVILPGAKLL